MLSDKDWIKKLDDKNLKYLMNRQDVLEEMPEDLEHNLSLLPSKYEREKEKLLRKVKVKRTKLVIKYSLSFAAVFIILFTSLFIYYNYFFQNINAAVITFVENKAYIYSKNKKEIITEGIQVGEKSIIETDIDSSAFILIGNKSNIILREKSIMLFENMKKIKDLERTTLYLEKGLSEFEIGKLKTNSSFIINTESLITTVIGTKFYIHVDEEKNTEIKIDEGTVYIRPNYKIDYKNLNKIDSKFYRELIGIINSSSIPISDKLINVSNGKVRYNEKKINNEIDQLIQDLEKYKKNKVKLEETKYDAVKKIFEIINDEDLFRTSSGYESLIKNQTKNINTEQTDDIIQTGLIIKKLEGNSGIILNEKNTAVSAGYSIYITSDYHKQLIAVNPESGKLQWRFFDPKITNLTSPAILYKNKIYLATNKNIFILNAYGRLETIHEISGGPVYWASSLITKGSLYIPGNDMVYKFTDNNLSEIKSISNKLGQLYIASDYDNNLICSNLNTRIIAGYDLSKNKSIWFSDSLSSRSFNAPAYNAGNIFISDSVNNIYKFNYNSKNSTPLILNTGTGIISNIIAKNNNIYFVAVDGNLYKVNISNFNNVEKIIKADKNPEANKYLTKDLLLSGDYIYFSSDTGKALCLDLVNDRIEMIYLEGNTNPLIGSPVKIKNSIYFIDNKSNIYKLNRN